MLIQDRTQHRGKLFCTVLDIDAIEGHGLTLYLCLRDLLSAVQPHELRFVCVELQSVYDIHLSSFSMHAVIRGIRVTHDEAGVRMKSCVSSAYECGVIP